MGEHISVGLLFLVTISLQVFVFVLFVGLYIIHDVDSMAFRTYTLPSCKCTAANALAFRSLYTCLFSREYIIILFVANSA